MKKIKKYMLSSLFIGSSILLITPIFMVACSKSISNSKPENNNPLPPSSLPDHQDDDTILNNDQKWNNIVNSNGNFNGLYIENCYELLNKINCFNSNEFINHYTNNDINAYFKDNFPSLNITILKESSYKDGKLIIQLDGEVSIENELNDYKIPKPVKVTITGFKKIYQNLLLKNINLNFDSIIKQLKTLQDVKNFDCATFLNYCEDNIKCKVNSDNEEKFININKNDIKKIVFGNIQENKLKIDVLKINQSNYQYDGTDWNLDKNNVQIDIDTNNCYLEFPTKIDVLKYIANHYYTYDKLDNEQLKKISASTLRMNLINGQSLPFINQEQKLKPYIDTYFDKKGSFKVQVIDPENLVGNDIEGLIWNKNNHDYIYNIDLKIFNDNNKDIFYNYSAPLFDYAGSTSRCATLQEYQKNEGMQITYKESSKINKKLKDKINSNKILLDKIFDNDENIIEFWLDKDLKYFLNPISLFFNNDCQLYDRDKNINNIKNILISGDVDFWTILSPNSSINWFDSQNIFEGTINDCDDEKIVFYVSSITIDSSSLLQSIKKETWDSFTYELFFKAFFNFGDNFYSNNLTPIICKLRVYFDKNEFNKPQKNDNYIN